MAALSLLCLGLPLSLMAVGYDLGARAGAEQAHEARISAAEEAASRRAQELAQVSTQAKQQLEVMARKLALLQARVTRLDALGGHLTAIAGLDDGEFSFATPPAFGGPVEPLFEGTLLPKAFNEQLAALGRTLDDRDTQLDVLSGLLAEAELRAETMPSGRPIDSGWLSSDYGYRTDPFTGKRAWHAGVDFAGRAGSAINAVASGVVSWSGERAGYGNLVEVAHGDGLVTRYGHNEENLVQVGDLVRKGQPIALMGNSGRSTGPHVHFEVYKHGRPVDPSSYVQRNVR